MVGKFCANRERGWEVKAPLEGPYLTIRCMHVPPQCVWERPHLGPGKDVRGITVDGELVYPVVPHPKCVAVGIFQGSCLWKGHRL